MILYNLRGWRRCPHPVASLSICCYRFFALLVLQSPKKSPEWLLSCVSFCLSIVSDDTPMTSFSYCLKAAMFIWLICSSSLRCFAFSSSICHLSILSIWLICSSNFSCFFLSSWICRLYLSVRRCPAILRTKKASNQTVNYIICLVLYIQRLNGFFSVAFSVQASMTLSTAYFDDCFFSTVKSKCLPL